MHHNVSSIKSGQKPIDNGGDQREESIENRKAVAEIYYSMDGEKLLIISNHYMFQKTPRFQPSDRDYTHKDVNRLKKVFSKLGFKVIVFEDLTYQQIINNLTAIGARDHTNTSCICVAILTHGADGGMLCAADRLYPLSEVMAIFETKSLANKPKIYLVQACRGDRVDPGYLLKTDGNALGWLSLWIAEAANFLRACGGGRMTPNDTGREEEGRLQYKTSNADTFVIFASVKGYVSYRYVNGTPMIQELCKAIEKHAKNYHFAEMVTIMKSLVAHRYPGKQMPETISTATKFLKF